MGITDEHKEYMTVGSHEHNSMDCSFTVTTIMVQEVNHPTQESSLKIAKLS